MILFQKSSASALIRAFLWLFLGCFVQFPVFSQIVSRSVVPSPLFVGDTALFRVEFNSKKPFLPEDFSGEFFLKTDFPPFLAFQNHALVRSASLSSLPPKKDSLYSYLLLLKITVWQEGSLDFPVFDAGALVQYSRGGEAAFPVQRIELSSVNVESALTRSPSISFLPHRSPLFLKGTAFVLLFFAFLLLCGTFFLILFFLRFRAFSSKWQTVFFHVRAKKNARRALKNLKKLKKTNATYSDSAFCKELQNIVRSFLEKKCAADFSALTSFEIKTKIAALFENEIESFACFFSVLYRTDAVRFSCGDFALLPDERASLLDCVSKSIFDFLKKKEDL